MTSEHLAAAQRLLRPAHFASASSDRPSELDEHPPFDRHHEAPSVTQHLSRPAHFASDSSDYPSGLPSARTSAYPPEPPIDHPSAYYLSTLPPQRDLPARCSSSTSDANAASLHSPSVHSPPHSSEQAFASYHGPSTTASHQMNLGRYPGTRHAYDDIASCPEPMRPAYAGHAPPSAGRVDAPSVARSARRFAAPSAPAEHNLPASFAMQHDQHSRARRSLAARPPARPPPPAPAAHHRPRAPLTSTSDASADSLDTQDDPPFVCSICPHLGPAGTRCSCGGIYEAEPSYAQIGRRLT